MLDPVFLVICTKLQVFSLWNKPSFVGVARDLSNKLSRVWSPSRNGGEAIALQTDEATPKSENMFFPCDEYRSEDDNNCGGHRV